MARTDELAQRFDMHFFPSSPPALAARSSLRTASEDLEVDVALKHDAENRPDFVAPIYPVIPKQFQVPSDAPPLFVAAANDDAIPKPVQHSVRLYAARSDAGKPAALHIYSEGGHGFGMKTRNLPIDSWKDRLLDWMTLQHLATR